MRAIVLGSGVAGCAAGLLLSRRGHEVTVLDRSRPPAAQDADAMFDSWTAEGIPQHRQPHNFLGLGRAVLREELPDVYADLLAAGAVEIDQRVFLGDAQREHADDDLLTLACRRPVFDAVLRRTVPSAQQVEVTGLTVEGGRVTGAQTSDGAVAADLVVDALGRGSTVARWLAAAGHPQPDPQESECGLLYYSRHYRVRDDEPFPPYASILAGPRGDVGYLAFATFVGDNRTFSLAIMIPPADRALRELRDVGAFQRVARLLPTVGPWLEVADPVTDVIPMGQLRNRLRPAYDVPGLVALGDARCHTNPTFAFGASLSLAQAALLAELSVKLPSVDELLAAFNAEVEPDLQERYDAITAEDRDRARAWGGEPLDLTDAGQTMPLFLRTVVYRVAPQDPELFRTVARRVNALDPVGYLASREDLLARAKDLYGAMRDTLPAPPRREDLLAAVRG
ncbi:MAG: NAD(P)/FAD-dependent oxidoreductase [Mycobacteriales bacterium]